MHLIETLAISTYICLHHIIRIRDHFYLSLELYFLCVDAMDKSISPWPLISPPFVAHSSTLLPRLVHHLCPFWHANSWKYYHSDWKGPVVQVPFTRCDKFTSLCLVLVIPSQSFLRTSLGETSYCNLFRVHVSVRIHLTSTILHFYAFARTNLCAWLEIYFTKQIPQYMHCKEPAILRSVISTKAGNES